MSDQRSNKCYSAGRCSGYSLHADAAVALALACCGRGASSPDLRVGQRTIRVPELLGVPTYFIERERLGRAVRDVVQHLCTQQLTVACVVHRVEDEHVPEGIERR